MMEPFTQERGKDEGSGRRAALRILLVLALGVVLYSLALRLPGEAFIDPGMFTDLLWPVTLGGVLAWVLLRIGARMAAPGPEPGSPLASQTLKTVGMRKGRLMLGHAAAAIVIWLWSAMVDFDRGFPWPVLCGPLYALYLAVRAGAMCSADWRMERGEELKLAGFDALDIYRARMLPVRREALWAALVFVSSLYVMARGDLGSEWLSFIIVNWFLLGLMFGAMFLSGSLALGSQSLIKALGLALIPTLGYAGLVYWIFSLSHLPFGVIDMLFSAGSVTDFLIAAQIFTLPFVPGPLLAIWLTRELGRARPLMILKSWIGWQLAALGLSLLCVFAVFVAGQMRYFIETPYRWH